MSPDVEGHWQSSAFGEKPVEDAGTKAREVNPEPTRAETKGKTEEAPVIGKNLRGEDVKLKSKGVSEYHPIVQEQAGALPDQKLVELARAHGLDPNKYDFSKRDANRHRVEREQLVKEITDQMGDDEKINIGRSADRLEHNQDMASKTKAERATSLFPRLRGPVDEFGNPRIGGGAPDTVGTKEAADKDNEHFANAKKELGDKASISDVAKRAQEMKDAAKPLDIAKSASEFNKTEGRTDLKKDKVEKSPRGKDISAAYESMKHDPENPEVKKSYNALVDDTKKQWAHAEKMGIKLEPTDEDPYKSFEEMRDDVKDNKRLKIFRGGNPLPEDHPLAKVDPKTGESYNTMFRAVHDLFGHLAQEHDFSEKGEENAWNVHRQMMSPEAVPAMSTETRGQTSWFFNHSDKPGEFAEQKAGILPNFANAPSPTTATMRMSDDELLKHGYTKDDIENGIHLPNISGGSGKLPTGDDLIKKYGESSGDPAHTTFILKDGRGVANTGIEHDHMLGGRTDEKVPPRERFIAEGNIRVRPRSGGKSGREVSISIPESGINEKQMAYLQKMAPQLKSGAVLIEVGKPGGGYKVIPYGEATPEALHKAISDIASVKNGEAKAPKLPKLAEEHLTPEEKAGVTKSEAGRQSFVDKLKKLPSVQEFVDIAKAGEGGRKWYQRSAAAFDALTEEAPKYFQQGDRQKFTDFLAALSPQQTVKMNLGEALNAWTRYVDDGRPTGKELEKLLKDELTLPGAKVPNATKALAGEPLWPDLSKNANFKVPSFANNLQGYLNHVTSDGWQALFGGLDAKAIAKPTSYHPLSVVTRAAAQALGWEPAEAQAAIWAFTKTLTEKGETEPKEVRRMSEDFADILALDPEIRQQLAQLGVNHDQLDTKLRAIGKKPAITPGASPTTQRSIGKLTARIETARGKGTIPPPKSGTLNFDNEDEDTRFSPEDFGSETVAGGLKKLGEKKSRLGKIK
jgi:hypothetical protein